jgi:hypothetical protein
MAGLSPAAPKQKWLNKGILGVGAASFFSDAGHELTTSLLPSFLTSVLHAGPAALGQSRASPTRWSG